MNIERSDLEKISDVLHATTSFHKSRDEMNAVLHLAETVRYSPLTTRLDAECDRIDTILGEKI